jgi:hypothetical protein
MIGKRGTVTERNVYPAINAWRDLGEKRPFLGLSIWAMFWLFQEWFIYHTLLAEPLLLNLLELSILLVGSLIEGVVIAFFLAR